MLNNNCLIGSRILLKKCFKLQQFNQLLFAYQWFFAKEIETNLNDTLQEFSSSYCTTTTIGLQKLKKKQALVIHGYIYFFQKHCRDADAICVDRKKQLMSFPIYYLAVIRLCGIHKSFFCEYLL